MQILLQGTTLFICCCFRDSFNDRNVLITIEMDKYVSKLSDCMFHNLIFTFNYTSSKLLFLFCFPLKASMQLLLNDNSFQLDSERMQIIIHPLKDEVFFLPDGTFRFL